MTTPKAQPAAELPVDAGVWREAIAIANVPTLLMVLFQMTGERRWLEEPYHPTRTQGLGDNDSGGFPEEVQDEIRAAALGAILAWQAGRPLAVPVPSDDLLVEMMSVSLGETIPPEYAPMIAHELGVAGSLRSTGPDEAPATPGRPLSTGGPQDDEHHEDHEQPHGVSTGDTVLSAAPPPGFKVLIIGAGVSGLCAAIRLKEAGVAYTIVEKNETVGGTWLENRYPGCGVDVPSHLYSFSFAPNDWRLYFALRDELFEYFERVATELGATERIRFRTEVKAARYDEEAQGWAVEVVNADGSTETLRADVVISAVGAFNKPRVPKVEGFGSFAGPSAHTAQWPKQGIDLEGRRVAVVGNGASAMQLVPAIADVASSIVVFQRSPQWAAPFEKYKMAVPEPVKFLLRALPLYRTWYRLRLSWAFNDKIWPALQKDPSWPHPERAVNAINDGHRRYFTRYMESELGDRKDLLEKCLPDFPPFGKRMLLDNGWFRTIKRDHVELVTESVAEVCSDGVVTGSGTKYEADVLVWATGFDVVRFLAPMQIVGRSGRSLEEHWDGDDARAYLGTAIPDFPNFFVLYGPNAQFGHGGSLITVVERQMHYVMSVLSQVFAKGVGSIEVRQDVHDRYNQKVDEAHDHMVWTHQGMETYYRNSKGRVVVNNPFKIIDYWQMTDTADLGEYLTEPRRP